MILIVNEKIKYLLVWLLVLGCQSENKTLNFGYFTIDIPASWHSVKVQGIDSYIGLIVIDDNDTLSFDLGWYSNDLSSEEDIFEMHAAEIIQDDGSIFIPERLRKNSSSYEVIDGRRAKIVQPKQSGEGTTGVYFDSLWKAGDNIDRFQLNGHNLKPENEEAVLQAIRTLKFFNKRNKGK